jgi:hypothetical protein
MVNSFFPENCRSCSKYIHIYVNTHIHTRARARAVKEKRKTGDCHSCDICVVLLWEIS